MAVDIFSRLFQFANMVAPILQKGSLPLNQVAASSD
jgi:hypothetical protein